MRQSRQTNVEDSIERELTNARKEIEYHKVRYNIASEILSSQGKKMTDSHIKINQIVEQGLTLLNENQTLRLKLEQTEKENQQLKEQLKVQPL
jgi:hypothetical protein